MAVVIVVLVPSVVVRVLDVAHVMAIGKTAVVVDHSAEVVLCGDVICLQELVILHEVAQVQIVQREFNHCLELAPGSADSLEPLELDGEYRRRPEDLEGLLLLPVFFALTAVDLVGQLLHVMVHLQTFVQTYVLLFNLDIHHVDRAMPHNLIASRVVLVLDHLTVPFDGDVALLQPVVDADGLIGFDYASTALLGPVALRAAIALPIHHLEHKWFGTTSALGICRTVQELLPVLLVPPKVFFFKVS